MNCTTIEIELGDIDARIEEINVQLPPLEEELNTLICELDYLLSTVVTP